MNSIEVLISRLNRIIREAQDAISIAKAHNRHNTTTVMPITSNAPTAGKSRKVRTDRVYLSRAEKQRAYRQRKKGLTIQAEPQPNATTP
jgi:hypothetical protein